MPPVTPNAREVAALRGVLGRAGGRASWQALEQVATSEAFQAFLRTRHASLAPLLAGPGRRRVLQVMAASFSLAGLASCARHSSDGYSEIVPYVNQPTGLTAGTPLSYASASLLDGFANGMLVTTIDGRPIKLEGNPDHPWSQGGTDAFAQASVLALYDPDRSQAVLRLQNISDRDSLQVAARNEFAAVRARRGHGLHLLTGPTTSPTFLAQLQHLRQTMPELHWHVHAPISREAIYQGTQAAFGEPLEPRWHFDKAEVIVSLDGDFLDPGPQQIGASRRWADARRRATGQGRLLPLYSVAPVPSLTAAKADFRQTLADRDLQAFATALLHDIAGGEASQDGPLAEFRQAVKKALQEAHGRSIVLTGTHQSAALHETVHRINDALGNTGQTVSYSAPVAPQAESLRDLIDAMQRGAVSTLIMLDTNPAYTAPADADFNHLLGTVPFKLHAGLHVDETALRCDWHLPLAHPLESWGDARALDGTVTLIQPTVRPLYGGLSISEALSLLTDSEPQPGLALLQQHWQQQMGSDFAQAWRQALLAGYVANTALPARPVTLKPPSPTPTAGNRDPGLDVLFRPDPTIWDGSFANNAWLQELPKPLGKLVWQNAIGIAPQLAATHGLADGDVVIVESGKHRIEGPVHVMPQQDAQTILLHLGYGRRQSGSIGNDIGFNAYDLRADGSPWRLAGAKLIRTGKREDLAFAQQRDEMTPQDFVRLQPIGGAAVGDDAAFTQPTLYQRAPEDGRAWGMVIDLDACIGCNACVVACQAENNVPVVGKAQFMTGRDMHWLRVDRYDTGAHTAAGTHFMPVPCMHCEAAPCELGCPVEATLHDSEGLNLMVYNRCIGTRACSAYCPYKVRHFNYLDYAEAPPSVQAQHNPDVTVRARGVMEKCTYCVQRIVAGRVAADQNNRPIRDGEVVTACASACPTQAIRFGDLADETSAVAAARKDPRNYALLGELNTRPRTTYLAAFAPLAKQA